MTPPSVRVVYRKYDGSLHWHFPMVRLGEDRHGVWLGAPPGTVTRKGVDGPSVVYRHAWVLLVPPGAWWTAVFNDEVEPLVEVYSDMTTVPEWRGDEVTMVDLDLDVIRSRDGRVEIVDRDEFEQHSVRYGYPPEIVSGAERAAQWMSAALGDGADPFGYRPWLAQVVPG